MSRHHPPAGPTRASEILARMAIALLLLAAAAALGEAIYKWVDARGVTHYGSTPPDGVAAQRVAAPPALNASQAALAASASQRLREESERIGRDLAQSRMRDASTADAERRALQERRARCALARAQVQALETGGPVYRRDARGERIYLPDSERDAEIARWRSTAQADCAGLESDSDTTRFGDDLQSRQRCALARERETELRSLGARISEQDLQAARRDVERVCATGTR